MTVDLTKILIGVTLGRPAPENESPEAAKIRARFKADVEKMKRDGLVIDIPGDNP